VNPGRVNDEKNPAGFLDRRRSMMVWDPGDFLERINIIEKSQIIFQFLAKIFRTSGCLCREEIMLAFLHQKNSADQFIIAIKPVTGR
jgi:hypothetical protein